MNLDALRKQLQEDEGFRLMPYMDTTGHITIGYGHNLTDVGITFDQAGAMLDSDIKRTVEDLDKFLPWWRQLDDVRQQALTNMAFNLGVDATSKPPGCLTTFQTFLTALRESRYDDAANAIGPLSAPRWNKQVGPRAIRIADMIRKGTP